MIFNQNKIINTVQECLTETIVLFCLDLKSINQVQTTPYLQSICLVMTIQLNTSCKERNVTPYTLFIYSDDQTHSHTAHPAPLNMLSKAKALLVRSNLCISVGFVLNL